MDDFSEQVDCEIQYEKQKYFAWLQANNVKVQRFGYQVLCYESNPVCKVIEEVFNKIEKGIKIQEYCLPQEIIDKNKPYTRYVCGFLFDKSMNEVLLILKNKPDWQKGHWNGIGGKIEDNELQVEAMKREFKEETLIQQEFDWKYFLELHVPKHKSIVYFYYALSECDYLRAFSSSFCKAEGEVVAIHSICNVHTIHTINNLKWIIPFARDCELYNKYFLPIKVEEE